MFYVSDIEAAGGIFIREKLVKKTCRYELIECLLYIMGEKFNVLLKEYKRGKGIVVAVKHRDDNEPFKEYDQLEQILLTMEGRDYCSIIENKRYRSLNKKKETILNIFNTAALAQSLTKLIICFENGKLLQMEGIIACITSIISIFLFFIIDETTKRSNRG